MSRVDLAITWVFAGATFLGILGWANHVRCGGWDEERLEEVAGRMVAMTRFAELGGVNLVDPTDLDRTIERIAEGASPTSGPSRPSREACSRMASPRTLPGTRAPRSRVRPASARSSPRCWP